MIEYDLAVGAGAIVEAWIVALLALRGRRPWLQASFAAFGFTLIVNAAAFVGLDAGVLSEPWEFAVFATTVLVYPLAAILVLGILQGESLPRQKGAIFLLLAAVPLCIFGTPSADWTASYAYELNPLGGFLGICLAIALAEPVYQQITGQLYARDAGWLIAGVLFLVVGGPVYTVEFAVLGLPVPAGSSPVAAAALAVFAAVALRTAPYVTSPRHRKRKWSGEGRLARGQVIAFVERRPAYVLRELELESSGGRPTLLVARFSAPAAPTSFAVARIGRGTRMPTRILSTASEFLARFPGGVVGLVDLGDVALLSGWGPTREMLARLQAVAEGTSGTVVLGTASLTPREREDLRATHVAWWTLPDPAQEMEAVLAQSFGPGARPLFAGFAQCQGLRPMDISVDRVPELAAFLQRSILEPGAAVADSAALDALRTQTGTAVEALRRFGARPAADLARGDWPSIAASVPDGELVVTPDAYWKGREEDALRIAAAQASDQPSIFERALAVFVEYLGPAGEGVLRSEVAKLGRQPQDLRAADVARLADRAAVDLSAMAAVVDVPQEKRRIQDQIESIRQRLESIAEVDRCSS